MFYLIAGALLFIAVALDILKTTLSTRGGGPLTNGLCRLVWRLFFFAAGRRGSAQRLEYAGQSVLVVILLSWVTVLWLSLFLMLWSAPGSVVNDTTGVAADAWETLYYAGFTLSTLGVGDFSASSDGWRVLTSIAAFSGLAFMTVAITYFVPVLSAVSLQQQLSLAVTSMGRTPQEILANSWNGSDFSAFYEKAGTIWQMLMQHSLNHHAYPVLRCFHASDARKSIFPAIVTLDEVLRLLDEEVATDIPQDRLRLRMLRITMRQHLDMLQRNYVSRPTNAGQAPDVDLQALARAGIALSHPRPADSAHHHSLTALLEADGWSWADVYGEGQGKA